MPWQKDNKVCFLRIEGPRFGDVPMNLELRLSVEDSPNSAGVVIDAIRCCKLARDRGAGRRSLFAFLLFHEAPAQAAGRSRGPPAHRRIRGGERREPAAAHGDDRMTPAAAAAFSAAPAAALVASFLVFTALRRSRAAPDADAAARGGRRLLGLHLRDFWYWLHAPMLRAALRAGATPDALTLGGLALTLGAGLAFAAGSFGLGGWLIVVGGALDILDGKVARARGLTRPAGAFLDSTLDRYGDWALFAGLAVAYGHGWPQWAALLALGGTFVVSYARARGESLGVECREGWLQRGERFFFWPRRAFSRRSSRISARPMRGPWPGCSRCLPRLPT